jgi:hypothetical protein
MALTPKQQRAIAHYCRDNNMRPELSSYPTYRFADKGTGEIVTHSISTLVDWYDQDLKKAAREKAQETRMQKGRE